jgi:hypothetical protein
VIDADSEATGVPVDEQWACPKCGFYNEYYAGYCVSCNELRPAEAAAPAKPEVSETPVYRPPLTTSLDPASYQPKPVVLSAPSQGPGSPTAPGPTKTKRSFKLPTLPKRRPFSAVIFIAIAIAALVANSRLDSPSSTADPYQVESSTQGVFAEPVDSAYLDRLTEINVARNDLVAGANKRWDQWLAKASGGFPTPEYLSVDQVEAFQTQAMAMTPPVASEAGALHESWLAALAAMVTAEQALAVDATQTTLDTELQAWIDEDAAFQALYDYCHANQ